LLNILKTLKGQDLLFFVALIASLFLIENTYIRVGIVVVGLFWLIMDLYEKKLVSRMDKDETVIYCEWESRINSTDFLATEGSTIVSLADIGQTLESALGNEYVFHTENSTGKDIYFAGKLLSLENEGIIIRANDQNDLA